jgi:Terminase small subunit
MRPLNYRQRLFVAYYLGESSGSAADAARKAGYKWPETQGPRLLKTDEIRAAIAAQVETVAISADEVLARLTDIATSDLMDFIAVDGNGDWQVDLKRIKRLGLGHLIKRLRKNKDGSTVIELEPRAAALIKLGDHYNLWKGEPEAQLTLVELAKSLEDDDEDVPRVCDDPVEKPAEAVPQEPGDVQSEVPESPPILGPAGRSVPIGRGLPDDRRVFRQHDRQGLLDRRDHPLVAAHEASCALHRHRAVADGPGKRDLQGDPPLP